ETGSPAAVVEFSPEACSDHPQYFLFPFGISFVNPVGADSGDCAIEPDSRIRCGDCSRICRSFYYSWYFIAVQARDHGCIHQAYGYIQAGQPGDQSDAALPCDGPGLEFLPQALIQ